MNICLWYPLNKMTDSNQLGKAAQVMQAAADLMAMDNADDVVEISKSMAGVMVEMLESTSEMVLSVALHLDQKQGGNVRRYNCQCKEEEKAE